MSIIRSTAERVFNANGLRYAGVFLLFVVLFSGKFSFDRFLNETSRTPWLELRIWALIGAVAVRYWLFVRFEDRISLSRSIDAVLLALIFCLSFYYVLNVHLVGLPDLRVQHTIDILFLFAGACLVYTYLQTEMVFDIFAHMSEAAGIVLFMFSLLGFGNPDISGPGWAPFGGPITFYRIEFLTSCSAFYLAFRTTSQTARTIHLMIAAIGLFSSFASLSKIAVVAIMLVGGFWSLWLLINSRLRDAVLLALVFTLSFASFLVFKSSVFSSRVDRSIAPIRQLVPESILVKYRPGMIPNDLTAQEMDYLLSLSHILHIPIEKDREGLSRFIKSMQNMVVLYDGTERLRMIQAAIGLYQSSNKWVGAGIGNYRFFSVSYFNRLEMVRHPHNIFIEAYTLTGVVGIILFTAALFIATMVILRRLLQLQNGLFIAGYALFVFLTAMFSGDYYDFRFYWYAPLMMYAPPKEHATA